MDRYNRRAGWTLVELMAGMGSGAVLAITAGAMLVYTFGAWQRDLALVGMQGDARVAVPTISMAIREARDAEVSVPGPGRLTLGRRSFYRANSALAYSASGRWLAYDPDTNAPNNEAALCLGRVAEFQCARGTNSVSFHLVIEEQGESLAFDGESFFRN